MILSFLFLSAVAGAGCEGNLFDISPLLDDAQSADDTFEEGRGEDDGGAAAQKRPVEHVQASGTSGEKGKQDIGIVYRYYVPVYDKPSVKARQVGGLRKGNALPVDVMNQTDDVCTGGWVYLPKGDGYACLSHGIKIRKEGEPFEWPLHPPWYDALLPYDYGRIGKDDLPAYNRFPTGEEKRQVQAWLAERRALLTAQVEAVKKAMEEGAPVPNPYEPIELQVNDEKGEVSTVATTDQWTTEVEEGPVPTDIPFKVVERILLHGFYVSIAYRTWNGGQPWVKTVRGFLVPGGSIAVKTPPATRGIELNEGRDLPVIFVKRTSASVFRFDPLGGKLKPLGEKKLSRFDSAVVLEKYEYGGSEYLKIGPEEYVRRSEVTLVEKSKPPAIVKSGTQKWIDVDVKQQVIVAYEGTKAVYAALVSTGKEKENIEFKTPRGIFSVLSKHVTGTMANLYASDGPYMIEDVPWTMYFLGSYALHGAFWHNSFGGMRSHGCVNLPPFDARWFFYWADPQMPEGWHSVYSGPNRPATIIKIRD
jgi:lipoprotein-anchoring transpeptidase ErfK/SrfK